MTWIIFLKAFFLLTGIVYTFSNIVKAFRKCRISSWQLWIMAISIVGYVTMEFWLGL